MEVKFYLCNLCKNVTELIHNGGGQLVCCGQPMEELVAQTADAAGEKHVPVAEKQGNDVLVKVGSVDHPMEDAHYIMWIAAVTDNGVYRVNLKPHEKPEALFKSLDGVKTYYEYCNIHGLWKVDA